MIISRLKEPSTHASLAVLLGIFGLKVAPDSIALYVNVAAGLFGILGVIAPEKT